MADRTVAVTAQETQVPVAVSAQSSPACDQLNPAWQSLQLTLWLMAGMLGLPDTAYRGLGLDKQELERLRRTHAGEIESLRMMQAAARLMDRRSTAELLRFRVNCMALAARTPSELAAVARTVRSLPDWVWEETLVSDDPSAINRPVPAVSSDTVEASLALGTGSANSPGSANSSWADLEGAADGMNRRQRRALEALLRKGR